jgi:hypothetical protein
MRPGRPHPRSSLFPSISPNSGSSFAYLIATALGGEAIPPTKWSGTDTSMNS